MYEDPRIDQLVRLLGEDEDVRAILESAGGPKSGPRLRRQLIALAFERGIDVSNPSEFARPELRLIAGPIPIGETEYAQPCGLTLRDLQHLTLYGRTRAGKTNFITHLLLSIHEASGGTVTWWNFDRKADYPFLALEPPAPVVIRADTDLRWNPLKPPPSVPLRKHIHRHVGLLVQALSLGEAARSLLIKVHRDLYNFFQPEERSGRWPTLHDLEHWLKLEVERSPKDQDLRGYVNRILNKLSPVLFVMGDVFACEDDFIHQLTEMRVVFQVDMLEAGILTYITSGLLQWYLSYRLDNGLRGPLEHLLIIDECKRLYDRQKEKNATEISYLAEVTSQIAEFGTGIIASDQQPSAVAKAIQANAASTACFALVDGADIWAVSESLRLTKAQADALPGLPPGTAVFRKSDGWVEPFILRVPLAGIRDRLTPLESME
jgi:hypothetical protein